MKAPAEPLSRGATLRRLRELIQVTQFELSRRAGCSERHVRRAEANDVRVWPAALEIIATALERVVRGFEDADPRVPEARRLLAELRLAAEPARAPEPTRFTRRWRAIRVTRWAWGALALGVGLLARPAVDRLWTPRRPDAVDLDLACPPRIRTHVASVFGQCRGCSAEHRIRVYVGSGTLFWLQGDRGAEPDARGRWMVEARFGNPSIDNARPLPLEYRVVAALTTVGATARLPGTWADPEVAAGENDFAAMLRGQGALAVTPTCVVERLPPVDCSDAPRIVAPATPPEGLRRLRSPVRVEWTPDLPMWVEVRSGTREVPGISGQTRPNRTLLPLPAGRYEIKVRRGRDFACADEVWIDVEGQPGRHP